MYLHNTTILSIRQLYLLFRDHILAEHMSDPLLQQSITRYSNMSLTTNHRTLLHKYYKETYHHCGTKYRHI